jgi:hypothetical protein
MCYRPGNSIGYDLVGRPIQSFEVESTPLGRGFGSDLKYRALNFQGHVEMQAKGVGYGRGGARKQRSSGLGEGRQKRNSIVPEIDYGEEDDWELVGKDIRKSIGPEDLGDLE